MVITNRLYSTRFLIHEFSDYYLQAKEGHCNVSKPGFFDFAGRAKW